MGVAYFRDADDFCEQHPDVVILSTSILSLEQVLGGLPIQRLRRNTLFVDVLSVKEFPKRLLLARLPPQVDILCTHPMFGPDSGKGSWAGLNLMYERVRVGRGEQRAHRVDTLLKFFSDEGCTMVEMPCEEHDRQAASTQFITHTVGRMLGEMGLEPTPIDTRGYRSLLSLWTTRPTTRSTSTTGSLCTTRARRRSCTAWTAPLTRSSASSLTRCTAG